jgi:hypothetical protein
MYRVSAIELTGSHVVLGDGLRGHISEVEPADDRDSVYDIAGEVYSRNAAGEDGGSCGYGGDELHRRVSWRRLEWLCPTHQLYFIVLAFCDKSPAIGVPLSKLVQALCAKRKVNKGFVLKSDDAQERLYANARRLIKAEPKCMERGAGASIVGFWRDL